MLNNITTDNILIIVLIIVGVWFIISNRIFIGKYTSRVKKERKKIMQLIRETIELTIESLEEIRSEKDIKIIQEKINKLIKVLNTAKDMFK